MAKPCNADTYRKAAFQLALGEAPRIVVEVGVYAGALSRMLASLPTLERLYVIDSWKGDYCKFGQPHMDGIADGVIAWGKTDPKVDVRRLDSRVAAEQFEDESIDFWHTDGDHSLAGIMGDINAWRSKVKPGGIMSGDNFEIPEVAKGVKTLLPQFKLLANGRLWWVQLPLAV
jgi:predicted O-methyltransferase YrrM